MRSSGPLEESRVEEVSPVSPCDGDPDSMKQGEELLYTWVTFCRFAQVCGGDLPATSADGFECRVQAVEELFVRAGTHLRVQRSAGGGE